MELSLPLGRIRGHQHLAQRSLFCISSLPAIVHNTLNFFKANAALTHPCDQVRVQICFCDFERLHVGTLER
jgi:hypothetical protein